jgi:hypothetical protein
VEIVDTLAHIQVTAKKLRAYDLDKLEETRHEK